MQPRRSRTCFEPTARSTILLALALGAALAGAPVCAAEEGPARPGPLLDAIGPPKPVRTVTVPAQPEAAKPTAPATPASPARYDGDGIYKACLDAFDGTNAAWGACGKALLDREDARLNAAWNRIYAPGSTAKSPELLAEQRAWLAFRDASCTVYLSGRFGREGEVLSYPVCRAAIVAERSAALDLYGDPEGR